MTSVSLRAESSDVEKPGAMLRGITSSYDCLEFLVTSLLEGGFQSGFSGSE